MPHLIRTSPDDIRQHMHNISSLCWRVHPAIQEMHHDVCACRLIPHNQLLFAVPSKYCRDLVSHRGRLQSRGTMWV